MDPEPQPDTEAAAPPPAADAAPDASGKGSKKGKGLGKKRGSASQDQQDAASTTTEGATQEQPPRKGITKKGPAAAPVLDLAGTIEKIEEAFSGKFASVSDADQLQHELRVQKLLVQESATKLQEDLAEQKEALAAQRDLLQTESAQLVEDSALRLQQEIEAQKRALAEQRAVLSAQSAKVDAIEQHESREEHWRRRIRDLQGRLDSVVERVHHEAGDAYMQKVLEGKLEDHRRFYEFMEETVPKIVLLSRMDMKLGKMDASAEAEAEVASGRGQVQARASTRATKGGAAGTRESAAERWKRSSASVVRERQSRAPAPASPEDESAFLSQQDAREVARQDRRRRVCSVEPYGFGSSSARPGWKELATHERFALKEWKPSKTTPETRYVRPTQRAFHTHVLDKTTEAISAYERTMREEKAQRENERLAKFAMLPRRAQLEQLAWEEERLRRHEDRLALIHGSKAKAGAQSREGSPVSDQDKNARTSASRSGSPSHDEGASGSADPRERQITSARSRLEKYRQIAERPAEVNKSPKLRQKQGNLRHQHAERLAAPSGQAHFDVFNQRYIHKGSPSASAAELGAERREKNLRRASFKPTHEIRSHYADARIVHATSKSPSRSASPRSPKTSPGGADSRTRPDNKTGRGFDRSAQRRSELQKAHARAVAVQERAKIEKHQEHSLRGPAAHDLNKGRASAAATQRELEQERHSAALDAHVSRGSQNIDRRRSERESALRSANRASSSSRPGSRAGSKVVPSMPVPGSLDSESSAAFGEGRRSSAAQRTSSSRPSSIRESAAQATIGRDSVAVPASSTGRLTSQRGPSARQFPSESSAQRKSVLSGAEREVGASVSVRESTIRKSAPSFVTVRSSAAELSPPIGLNSAEVMYNVSDNDDMNDNDNANDNDLSLLRMSKGASSSSSKKRASTGAAASKKPKKSTAERLSELIDAPVTMMQVPPRRASQYQDADEMDSFNHLQLAADAAVAHENEQQMLDLVERVDFVQIPEMGAGRPTGFSGRVSQEDGSVFLMDDGDTREIRTSKEASDAVDEEFLTKAQKKAKKAIAATGGGNYVNTGNRFAALASSSATSSSSSYDPYEFGGVRKASERRRSSAAERNQPSFSALKAGAADDMGSGEEYAAAVVEENEKSSRPSAAQAWAETVRQSESGRSGGGSVRRSSVKPREVPPASDDDGPRQDGRPSGMERVSLTASQVLDGSAEDVFGIALLQARQEARDSMSERDEEGTSARSSARTRQSSEERRSQRASVLARQREALNKVAENVLAQAEQAVLDKESRPTARLEEQTGDEDEDTNGEGVAGGAAADVVVEAASKNAEADARKKSVSRTSRRVSGAEEVEPRNVEETVEENVTAGGPSIRESISKARTSRRVSGAGARKSRVEENIEIDEKASVVAGTEVYVGTQVEGANAENEDQQGSSETVPVSEVAGYGVEETTPAASEDVAPIRASSRASTRKSSAAVVAPVANNDVKEDLTPAEARARRKMQREGASGSERRKSSSSSGSSASGPGRASAATKVRVSVSSAIADPGKDEKQDVEEEEEDEDVSDLIAMRARTRERAEKTKRPSTSSTTVASQLQERQRESLTNYLQSSDSGSPYKRKGPDGQSVRGPSERPSVSLMNYMDQRAGGGSGSRNKNKADRADPDGAAPGGPGDSVTSSSSDVDADGIKQTLQIENESDSDKNKNNNPMLFNPAERFRASLSRVERDIKKRVRNDNVAVYDVKRHAGSAKLNEVSEVHKISAEREKTHQAKQDRVTERLEGGTARRASSRGASKSVSKGNSKSGGADEKPAPKLESTQMTEDMKSPKNRMTDRIQAHRDYLDHFFQDNADPATRIRRAVSTLKAQKQSKDSQRSDEPTPAAQETTSLVNATSGAALNVNRNRVSTSSSSGAGDRGTKTRKSEGAPRTTGTGGSKENTAAPEQEGQAQRASKSMYLQADGPRARQRILDPASSVNKTKVISVSRGAEVAVTSEPSRDLAGTGTVSVPPASGPAQTRTSRTVPPAAAPGVPSSVSAALSDSVANPEAPSRHRRRETRAHETLSLR